MPAAPIVWSISGKLRSEKRKCENLLEKLSYYKIEPYIPLYINYQHTFNQRYPLKRFVCIFMLLWKNYVFPLIFNYAKILRIASYIVWILFKGLKLRWEDHSLNSSIPYEKKSYSYVTDISRKLKRLPSAAKLQHFIGFSWFLCCQAW